MATVSACRCLGCGLTDERRRVEWALKDAMSRCAVCITCFRGAQSTQLRERFVREVEKARATVGTL